MDTTMDGIIFDYGGTPDNNGDHWAQTLYDAYATLPCGQPDLDTFRRIYVFAEREMARRPIVRPNFTFYDTILVKARLELTEWGVLTPDEIDTYAAAIAKYCDNRARNCIDAARPVLDTLAAQYPMALVSNFYGNIESVLAEYGLKKYFPTVIESAVVGVRKPDPAIFALGIEALGTEAAHTRVGGDSISKDIEPARSLGCPTVWIKGRPWFGDTLPDTAGPTITTITALPTLLA